MEKSHVRRSGGAVCGRIACSTVRNAPTSELVAEIVPVNAPSKSTGNVEPNAKIMPPAIISVAIVATVRLRPYRSATSAQSTVMSADPRIAAESTSPTWIVSRPSRAR